MSETKRENVKDFYCWAFLNKDAHGLLDDEELEEYVAKFEKGLGRKLESGRGAAVPLRLTLDKVKMMHRPLVWYTVGSSFSDIKFSLDLLMSIRPYLAFDLQTMYEDLMALLCSSL